MHVYTISPHLEAGLYHLAEADERVAQMREELEQLQPEMQEKAEVWFQPAYVVRAT